jgi:hypothetical protein
MTNQSNQKVVVSKITVGAKGFYRDKIKNDEMHFVKGKEYEITGSTSFFIIDEDGKSVSAREIGLPSMTPNDLYRFGPPADEYAVYFDRIEQD